MRSILHTALALLLCTSAMESRAQLFPNLGGQRAGASALSFLKNDVSPRSAGMAGASVALDHDPFALFHNPAGTAQAEGLTFAGSSFLPGSGISQSFFSAFTPVGKSGSAMGLSFNTLSSGAMEVRTEFQPEGTGQYFYATNLAAGLTYSRKLSEMFSFGVTMKYLYEQYAEYTNSTVAADLGFLYRTDFRDLRFAVMVQNFGGNSALNGDFLEVDYNRDSVVVPDRYAVPTVFKLGASITALEKDEHKLMAAFQLDHPNDNAENLRLGFEYAYRELLFARTGIKINVKGQGYPVLGLGLRSRIGSNPLMIHYSVVPTYHLGMQHVFGLSLKLVKNSRETQEDKDAN